MLEVLSLEGYKKSKLRSEDHRQRGQIVGDLICDLSWSFTLRMKAIWDRWWNHRPQDFRLHQHGRIRF